MMRRRRFIFGLVVMIAAVTASGAYAHEHFRVIGTITKLDKKQFEVKEKTGKLWTIYVDTKTKVSRDKKPVAVATLKIGQSVVVDAYGDDETDLLALDIRIVPPIATSTTK
jgi:Domain of unknown function (DUF5666)